MFSPSQIEQIDDSSLEEIVAGNSCHVNSVASAVTVGGAVGFLVGGPIGGLAGAISAGGHALVLSLSLC